MENKCDLRISFNPKLFVHTTTQIVTHYYKEFVEINEEFEKITEDEYSKMMFAKADNCKDKKERDKIANEYAENMQKYYPHIPNYSVLSFNDNISSSNGYILFKKEDVQQQYDLSLLDFISYNFNNLNDYYLFFINYFDYFLPKLDKEDLDKFKLITLYPIKNIITLARKYYEKEIANIKKYQQLFKNCINFCYQIDAPIDLNKLTLQQRFFIYNQLYINPFNEICNNFESINFLDYTYSNIPYNSESVELKDVFIISSIIHTYDPDGTLLLNSYQLKTNNIFTAFYITLFNVLSMDDFYIKICGNCKKYFLTPKQNAVYCSRELDSNTTCKDVGSKLSQKRKESEDYIYKKYRNEAARKAMLVSRNADISEYKTKYDKWKEKAGKFWNNVKKGTKTPEDFEKWIEKNK